MKTITTTTSAAFSTIKLFFMKVTHTKAIFLVVSLIVQQFTSAQTTLPDYCIDGSAIANYTSCRITNSASCNYCSNESSNITNIISLSCSDLTNTFCPDIRCCSACEDAAKLFYECTIFPLFEATNQQDCTLDCSSFPTGINHNVTTEPCDAVTGNWLACIFSHQGGCSACTNYGTTFNSSLFNATDDCAAVESYFCPFVDCCSSCQSESNAISQCILSQNFNSSASNCQFNCIGTGLDSNGTPNSGGSTNGGTNNSVTKSGATKNANFVLFSALASVVTGVTAAMYLM